jgi:monothiol glutaredoxin
MAANPYFETITNDIQTHAVVLYMKGSKLMPMCGFSGFVAQTLNRMEVDYYDVNVLENPEIRQAIKEYSDWPTIPQLYIKGEFIGGADIVRDMLSSGEFTELLQERGISFKTPV